MNCNTVVFCQALDINNSPSVCSVQQVSDSDMMNNSHTDTHTQSFWSITSERSEYLSFKTKKTSYTNISYTYQKINIACSTNSYGNSGVLQVHPEVHDPDQDHSGVLEGPFQHPLLQAALRRSGRGWCMAGLDTQDPGKACFKFLETHITAVMQM